MEIVPSVSLRFPGVDTTLPSLCLPVYLRHIPTMYLLVVGTSLPRGLTFHRQIITEWWAEAGWTPLPDSILAAEPPDTHLVPGGYKIHIYYNLTTVLDTTEN